MTQASLQAAGPQLENYPAIRTQSPDEIEHMMRSVYGARSFAVIGDQSEFFVHSNHKPVNDISLSYYRCGGSVKVDYPEASFVRQSFRISGEGIVLAGRSASELRINCALAFPAHRALKVHYSRAFEHLVLRIEDAALLKKLTALLGREPSAPLQFYPEEPVAEQMIVLRNLVMYLAQEIHALEEYAGASPIISELEQAIITAFLCTNRSNYTGLLRTQPKEVAPWQVRMVEDYILDNWNKPIDILQLVTITGASARSIFRAFARARGYSPMVFLKRTRLAHARTRLQSSGPNTSVSAVAFACGFQNLGNFAHDYYALFGELPSQTLVSTRSVRPILTERT
jgi:AraC-like DNA-binding protein